MPAAAIGNAIFNATGAPPRQIPFTPERVVTARLRDARFFWEADKKLPLESRMERLGTLLFHKKLGSYKDKAERIERLARAIARDALGADEDVAGHAARAS